MDDPQQDNQLQYILSDLGTRMREMEERTSSLKERLQLINSNMIDSKEELEQRVLTIEKQTALIASDMKKMSNTIQNLLTETNNFVRKDEIILVERMLKDFQPLEFVRRKDLEEFKESINIKSTDKILNTKEIKTRETTE
jgi:chaperonin cofactor prefoldin